MTKNSGLKHKSEGTMSEEIRRTEKHTQARNSLPPELIPSFDALVEHYRFYAVTHYGSPFVSYVVLADLIRAGWRLSADPLSQSLDK